MKFNKQAMILTIAGIAVALLLVFSLTNRTNPRATPPGTPQGQTMPDGTVPNRILDGGTPQNNVGTPNNKSRLDIGMPQTNGNQMQKEQTKASRIKKQLEEINGVDNPNVLVVNDTCVVGYKPGNRQLNTDQLRKTIEDKTKSADNSIKKVYVTDSADLTSRISSLSEDIINNRNMSGISDQVNNIIQKINPNR